MEEMNIIKILIKEPCKPPYVKEIENTYEKMKESVGGYLESVEMPGLRNVDIFVNEEGKLEHLPGNFWLPEYRDCVCGTCYIVGYDPDEGESISLTDNQIEKCKQYISNYELPEGLDLYKDFQLLELYMMSKYRKLKQISEM